MKQTTKFEEEIVDFHLTEDLFDIIEPIIRIKMWKDYPHGPHNPYPHYVENRAVSIDWIRLDPIDGTIRVKGKITSS